MRTLILLAAFLITATGIAHGQTFIALANTNDAASSYPRTAQFNGMQPSGRSSSIFQDCASYATTDSDFLPGDRNQQRFSSELFRLGAETVADHKDSNTRSLFVLPAMDKAIVTADAAPLSQPESNTPPPAEEPSSIFGEWSFSATVTTYIVPEGRSYVQPTITADRGWLHLEARYNYEGLDTTSLFAGYNMSFGDKLVLEATPLIGAVFGNTNGVAPGYKINLSYEKFNLYTEGEYLIDTDNSSDSYFYTWSEFTYSPLEWLRAGVVIQRTKAYQSDLDIQRGLLIGFTHDHFNFTAYVFNLGWEDPTYVFSIGASF